MFAVKAINEMEQFSHDLTLALEETSKCSGVSRWSTRRRTRSTGNLRKHSTTHFQLEYYSINKPKQVKVVSLPWIK